MLGDRRPVFTWTQGPLLSANASVCRSAKTEWGLPEEACQKKGRSSLSAHTERRRFHAAARRHQADVHCLYVEVRDRTRSQAKHCNHVVKHKRYAFCTHTIAGPSYQ